MTGVAELERRRAQIDWVLDYELDIASDLSAFHRVDDWRTLDGPRYFALANRLGAYTGVMQARIIELRKDEDGDTPTPAKPQTAKVSDDAMLTQLANEGWLERK